MSFAGDTVAEYGIDPSFFDRAGKVSGAASVAEDTHQMADLTGSTHYVFGLYTPGTVILQPAGFVLGVVT